MGKALETDGLKRRGRPPIHDGKRSNFATRIDKDMRAALEREAQRRGCSLSHAAEAWLEQGRFQQAAIDALANAGFVNGRLVAGLYIAAELLERHNLQDAAAAVRKLIIDNPLEPQESHAKDD